jgi:hypothetical protein
LDGRRAVPGTDGIERTMGAVLVRAAWTTREDSRTEDVALSGPLERTTTVEAPFDAEGAATSECARGWGAGTYDDWIARGSCEAGTGDVIPRLTGSGT